MVGMVEAGGEEYGALMQSNVPLSRVLRTPYFARDEFAHVEQYSLVDAVHHKRTGSAPLRFSKDPGIGDIAVRWLSLTWISTVILGT